MGCGYVKIFTHSENKAAIMQTIPEAVITCYCDETKKEERLAIVEQTAHFADVIALGAGIGTDKWAWEMTKKLLMADEKPIVIDADGCNTIAADKNLMEWLEQTAHKRHYPIIMTPHLLEFARLLGEDTVSIRKDFADVSMKFATRYGIILCAKDAVTLVTDGKTVYFNRSGNDAMATAGSGDVLFGMIASLLGQKMTAYEAACLGVYLHGLCGDGAKDRTNASYVTASDLVKELAWLLKRPHDTSLQ